MNSEQLAKLKELKRLLDSGVLTSEEVEREKQRILKDSELITPGQIESQDSKNKPVINMGYWASKRRLLFICFAVSALLIGIVIIISNHKSKESKDAPLSGSISSTINGHEWIDLGLPSGIKWATCNVGASDPEDYGDYFAWGETSSKDVYTWASYKFNLSSEENIITLNKYWDENNRLDLEDDAAWANWGNGWRIPTLEEVNELIDECSWSLSSLNGVNGSIVVGPNGNSIFLPSAGLQVTGLHGYSPPDYKEKAGYYYTSTLGSTYMSAYYLVFNSNSRKVEVQDTDRYAGMSIRPVVDSND